MKLFRNSINTARRYSTAPKPKKHIDPRRIFKVYRFDGTIAKGEPQMKNYDIDVSTCGKMVLDALIKIKDMDPTLAFRRSCREGMRLSTCVIDFSLNS